MAGGAELVAMEEEEGDVEQEFGGVGVKEVGSAIDTGVKWHESAEVDGEGVGGAAVSGDEAVENVGVVRVVGGSGMPNRGGRGGGLGGGAKGLGRTLGIGRSGGGRRRGRLTVGSGGATRGEQGCGGGCGGGGRGAHEDRSIRRRGQYLFVREGALSAEGG